MVTRWLCDSSMQRSSVDIITTCSLEQCSDALKGKSEGPGRQTRPPAPAQARTFVYMLFEIIQY